MIGLTGRKRIISQNREKRAGEVVTPVLSPPSPPLLRFCVRFLLRPTTNSIVYAFWVISVVVSEVYTDRPTVLPSRSTRASACNNSEARSLGIDYKLSKRTSETGTVLIFAFGFSRFFSRIVITGQNLASQRQLYAHSIPFALLSLYDKSNRAK